MKNREIKFRAWIKSNNSMQRCIEVNPFYIGDCDRCHWKHEEVELMQYTGLKDKNGVEIYEGDILAISYTTLITGLKVDKGVVEWKGYSDGEYARNIECWMSGESTISDCETEILEVIGTIYENPELLKENKIGYGLKYQM
jgi:uncharacterized phage protein (TIGR01671 family)